MHSLIKTSATLLILIAAFGTAGTAAGSLVDDARGLLDAGAPDLGALEARWAALGIPPELTAPASAIPAAARRTLDIPAELTATAVDVLSQAELDASAALTVTDEITAIAATTETLAVSGKVVALGALDCGGDGPVFLIEKAGPWEPDDGFYVHVRFIDARGQETAFCTHCLDAEGPRSWRLDPVDMDALPEDWRGVGLLTVHDGLEDGNNELSREHAVAVSRVTPAEPSASADGTLSAAPMRTG